MTTQTITPAIGTLVVQRPTLDPIYGVNRTTVGTVIGHDTDPRFVRVEFAGNLPSGVVRANVMLTDLDVVRPNTADPRYLRAILVRAKLLGSDQSGRAAAGWVS